MGLGEVFLLYATATQGQGSDDVYVTSYTLSHSLLNMAPHEVPFIDLETGSAMVGDKHKL